MNIKNIADIVLPEDKNKVIVFVTGVTGQDGSHMVDYLLREDHSDYWGTEKDIHIIGGARRLSVENHSNIKHLEGNPKFQLVNFDLTDTHSIYKIMEFIKPNYFINFAAQSFVASSWDFSKQTMETNAIAVGDCLEAIRKNNLNCKFYNAGSSEEFGRTGLYEKLNEKSIIYPRSPYGASKASARHLVTVHRESYHTKAIQGWLFNHEGTRRGMEFVTRKITKNVARIKNAIDKSERFDPLELGNLDATRDWSDAEDMVDAVWKMLNQWEIKTKNKKSTQVIDRVHGIDVARLYPIDYVVASGEAHSIREFVEEAFKVVGIEGRWEDSEQIVEEKTNAFGIGSITKPRKQSPSFVNISWSISTKLKKDLFTYEIGDYKLLLACVNPKFYRPAEVETLLGDASLIKEELGWKPKVNFKELVRKMVLNDLKNQS